MPKISYSNCYQEYGNLKLNTMEKSEILEKLKEEYRKLNKISDRQFEERFDTAKSEKRWYDELYKDYHTIRIRIDLLLELLT